MRIFALLPIMFMMSAPVAAQAQRQIRGMVVPAPVQPEPTTPSLPPLVPRPQAPYRMTDQCPFEFGCGFGVWQACEPLVVQRTPEMGAATVYRLTAMEHFHALRADMVITQIGRVRVDYPMDTDEHPRWPSFPIGTEVDVLDYAGEGNYGIWAAGRLWQMQGFWSRNPSPREPGRLMQAPQMTWWVNVETLDGHHGWLGMRNTVEDAEGIWFDEGVRMDDGPVTEDSPDCEQILRWSDDE